MPFRKQDLLDRLNSLEIEHDKMVDQLDNLKDSIDHFAYIVRCLPKDLEFE